MVTLSKSFLSAAERTVSGGEAMVGVYLGPASWRWHSCAQVQQTAVAGQRPVGVGGRPHPPLQI
jgi:hypothetical protein